MGTIALIGIGVFLGWLIFRPKNNSRPAGSAGFSEAKQRGVHSQSPHMSPAVPHRETGNGSNHTLRNVAGGMAAGAVLGHMLSSDHKTEAHEHINNYNTYNEYYDHEDMAADTLESDDDYEVLDYDNDDYDSYDSYDDDDYTSYDDESYDCGSDWGSDDYGDSYDDGGDW